MAAVIGRLALLALLSLDSVAPFRGAIYAADSPGHGSTGDDAAQLDTAPAIRLPDGQPGSPAPIDNDPAPSSAPDFADMSAGLFGDGWQPFVDGTPALVSFRRPPQLDLHRRAGSSCLANGTNFCFGGSSNNYCSSCGTCCSASDGDGNKWCCGADSVCCGSSCCASGQTCNNGQCYLPTVTVTVSGAVNVAVTEVVTHVATIVQSVVESSVVNSVTEVTATSGATQTDWVYVTATTEAKRFAPTLESIAHHYAAAHGVPAFAAATATVTHGLSINGVELELARRADDDSGSEATTAADAAPQSTAAITTTVSLFSTITSAVTKTVSSTTTSAVTSTQLSTLVQTNTRILHAETTVTATSTLTFTSHPPVTLTITEIATEHGSAVEASASTSTAPPTLVSEDSNGKSASGTARSKISSGAIAGIAVGSAIFAIFLGVLAVCCVRRRRRRRDSARQAEEDVGSYNYGLGRQPTYSGPPPPAAAGYGRKLSATAPLERGLPPIPFFSKHTSVGSADSSATAAVAGAGVGAGGVPLHKQHGSVSSTTSSQNSRTMTMAPGAGAVVAGAGAGLGYQKSHFRSPSGRTTRSSTVVGGSSNRTSLSTSGAGVLAAVGGAGAAVVAASKTRPHRSSTASRMTAATLAEDQAQSASPQMEQVQEIQQPADVDVQPPPHTYQPASFSSSNPFIDDAIASEDFETTTQRQHAQAQAQAHNLAAPSAPWANNSLVVPTQAGGVRGTGAESIASSRRSSLNNGRSNVLTPGGGFFYQDY